AQARRRLNLQARGLVSDVDLRERLLRRARVAELLQPLSEQRLRLGPLLLEEDVALLHRQLLEDLLALRVGQRLEALHLETRDVRGLALAHGELERDVALLRGRHL